VKEILKYSCLIFLYALSHSYLATCFAIDLKIKGYEERYIGLSLSFWGIGVILGALLHNLIRKKLNLFSTILYGSIIQLSFSLIFLIDQNTFLVALMQFVMGITSAINSLTLESHISSKFKKTSGFYISLFWSSAGLGAITGSLFIAINGINNLTYYIAILFFLMHFIPIYLFRSSISKIAIENLSLRLSKNVISKIKYLLFCVILFGACDAGFSSLFPSYLLEESYSDKQVGRINFLAGLIALVFYPFMGKLVDNYNKTVIFNTFCFINFINLFILYFISDFYVYIICVAFYYYTIGTVFLITFNIVGKKLEGGVIVFGIAGHYISENIGSFLGPNLIGNIVNIDINYFFLIFIFLYFLIVLLFNFNQIKNGGPSGT
jgi:predicted MFS family arabinose efflux permease|tara:strand:- start:1546 stop:2679 length:1134 start_codon:yes stop_codon:yes gene_type:complete